MATVKPDGELTFPGVVVFVDCETRPDPLKSKPGQREESLWFGYAVAGRIEAGGMTRRKVLRFDQAATFWDWLNLVKRPQQPVWLFAHRLAFDLTVLGFWDQLSNQDWKLSRERPLSPLTCQRRGIPAGSTSSESGIVISEDPPSAVLCWHASGWRLNCIDTLNYWPMALSKLGAGMGLEKFPMPDEGAPREEWDRYCLRDVEIIERAITELAVWWKTQELGRWPLTIAAGAMTAWRERWLPDTVETPDDPDQRRFERDACYGGRLEALWVGETGPRFPPSQDRPAVQTTFDDPTPRGPFHLLDANSFYGWIQSTTPVPVRTLAWWREGRDGELACPPLGGDCLAAVRVKHPTERFPLRHEGRLLFAVGEFDTVLAGPELERALACGAIQKTYEVCQYELSPVLSWFARGVWDEVQRAGRDNLGAVRLAAKTMLSRMPGKFAQNPFTWSNRPRMVSHQAFGSWGSIDGATGTIRHFRSIGWLVQEKEPGEDPDHVFPAIFAFVTAAGREHLRIWAEIAGPRNVLYLATDGLVVTQAGLERLEDAGEMRPHELGGLRVVESDDSVQIAGPGTYLLGDRRIAMGKDVAGREIAPGIWVAPRFQNLKGVFARGGGNTVAVTETTLSIPKRDVMGKVSPGGWVEAVALNP